MANWISGNFIYCNQMWRHWVVSVCLCVCDSSADNEGRTFGDWDVGWIAGENSLCV